MGSALATPIPYRYTNGIRIHLIVIFANLVGIIHFAHLNGAALPCECDNILMRKNKYA